MALPRQRSAIRKAVTQVLAGSSNNSKGEPNINSPRELARTVEIKLREVSEQVKKAQDCLQSGEMDFADFAD